MSDDGGSEPLWARSGETLYYRNGNALMSVSADTNPTFSPGNPEVVLEAEFPNLQGGRSYEVSPDGERFLIIKPIDTSAPQARIIVVANWFEELKRAVPTTAD